MDINTRLDGFIVHPLDAFNDHHHDYDTPKFSSTAPHLDGFQEHPLDAFISQEHNNDISTNNYFNYEDTNQVNNYFPTNETLTADNLLNLNQNNTFDSTVYQTTQIQDLISTPTTLIMIIIIIIINTIQLISLHQNTQSLIPTPPPYQ